MDLSTTVPTAYVHLFQYQTGGIAKLDISKSGCIITTNLTGTLQLFQPKEVPVKKEHSIRDRGPALVEPKSPRPSEPDQVKIVAKNF